MPYGHNDDERPARHIRLAGRTASPANPDTQQDVDFETTPPQQRPQRRHRVRRSSRRGPLVRPIMVLVCLALALVMTAASLFISYEHAGMSPQSEFDVLDVDPEPISTLAFSTPMSQWKRGTMPHIYQIDPAWSEAPYAGGTVRENGCGPTCLTMVYVFKTGKTDMTPADMCVRADAGGYAPTGATEWSFMTAGAARLGLSARAVGTTRSELSRTLRAGYAVIASVRPGTFTNIGHYIVLYGIDDASNVTVFDPNSQMRSARKWGIVEVLDQINAAWAY